MGIITVTITGARLLKLGLEASDIAPYCVLDYDQQQVFYFCFTILVSPTLFPYVT